MSSQLKEDVLDEATQLKVLGHFAADSCVLVRKATDITHVSIGSAHKIPRLHKFHSHKIQVLHALIWMVQILDFNFRIHY